MFRAAIDHTLCTLREALCPAREPERSATGELPGIIFTVDLHLSQWNPARDNFEECRETHFVLFCGNTNVFHVREPDDQNIFDISEIPLDAWDNPSNHDTCWRSDGMAWITKTYFAMAKELENRTRIEIAPKDCSDHSTLGRLRKPWTLVWVKHERTPEDRSGYRRQLASIRQRKVQTANID